jgi:signal transduction histidine kinase
MLATNTRFAAVGRVTEERWVACRTIDRMDFGLAEGDEIEIHSTFCQSVRETLKPVLFNDVATDETYRNHPIATRFGIVSYASIPIHRSDGSFFGTLCAVDNEPRDIKNPRAIAMLEMFARIIGHSLETQERLEAQERLVAQERELARIQEEFVAVLGHDLRNPVAALDAGLRQLDREPLTGKARRVLPLMRASLQRMNDLIDNIMLHAKARLGGGLRILACPDAPLAESLAQVVEELRAAAPEREIALDLAFDRPVACDAPRIAQAVSNLLSNALRHGAAGTPVTLSGAVRGSEAVITVANHGPPIPEALRQRLFEPYQRGTQTRGEGLGLGLYIAASIAGAHGGRIELGCEDGITRFALSLPVLSPPG